MGTSQDQHHREVFAEWMTEHKGIVFKIVRGFTLEPSDAEDLTQDIMLALWRSIPSFRGDAKPSTWIWRIAVNQAIGWKRTGGPEHSALDDLPLSSQPSANSRADDGLAVDRIYDAVRTLTPLNRALVILAFEGHSYSEIAEITGMTETNVGARLSRARTRLSQILEVTR